MPVLPRGLAHITAGALVPEQLLPYALAVSGSRAVPCGPCVGYLQERQLVLVGYPVAGQKADWDLEAVIAEALRTYTPERVTILAAERPGIAPADQPSEEDWYWEMPLPPPSPKQKLRHLLGRARREIRVQSDVWTPNHAELVHIMMRNRPLAPGTRHIFEHIPDYLKAVPGATLFSARSLLDNQLMGFCVGDYSALATAFYMFAFRHPDSPPGTADALLDALLAEGVNRGHSRANLGLGIDPGIAFFKKKWGATPFLPCIQTAWSVRSPSWWRKWF